MRDFPSDFIWGAATASYQVEGAAFEDGRSSSIWDDLCRQPGRVYAGENGDVAVDQYHRYKEDVELMKKLGFKAYRFSIAWPRVIPQGVGEVNKLGIEYYINLCKELKANGIKPCATLYHWDLPSCLEAKGGWRNRDTAYAFAEYADVCFKFLGKYVDMWITLNEPWCSSYLSYWLGEHAPGYKDINLVPDVIHHLNLAHGLAVEKFRERKLDSKIGITWNHSFAAIAPHVENKEELSELQFALDSGVFSDPVFKGTYPKEVERFGFKFPIQDGDMAIISQPIDFYGINYYTQAMIEPIDEFPGYRAIERWQDVTDMNWYIVPQGLDVLLRKMDEESGHLPVYITENGAAYQDVLTPDKRVHDKERIEYFRKHFSVMSNLIKDGIPLKGYFAWSFLDNFEWAFGYSKRFGIVYIDYKTLKRYPKDSAYYLRDVIDTGEVL